MSVISAVITKICTVHASDSFVTEPLTNGDYKVKEKKRSKIVRVRAWRGAMSYWGLAQVEARQWSTVSWLENRANRASAFSSPEEFATDLAAALTQELSQLNLRSSRERGIGIHFTAYERVNEYWIPELFLISNWLDTSYRALRPNGMGVTRETFHAISEEEPDQRHRESAYRLKVHTFLQEGKILGYNNGDPALYNPAANGLFSVFTELARRGNLANRNAVQMWTALARRPVEVVSKAQCDFCSRGRRLVGGKPHDLAVTPNGDYTSTTGD